MRNIKNNNKMPILLKLALMIMSILRYSSIHIIGCGGAGCAPLARLLSEKNFRVSGSDLIQNRNTKFLTDIGIPVYFGHCAENIPDDPNTLVIRSSAVQEDNSEYMQALQKGFPVIRRGEALAELTKIYPRSIAVAGSHGKTTVTAMISWVLSKMGKKPGIMIGGNISGWDLNGQAGSGTFFITEADESDGTNALLHPYIGIVTNVEDDHAWSVGGAEKIYDSFKIFAEHSQNLIYGSQGISYQLFSEHLCKISVNTDYIPADIPDTLPHFVRMDMEYAIAALKTCGYERSYIIQALADFPGVDRRFTVRGNGIIPVIEDYAHHPTEVKESILSIRKLYPKQRLLLVFQPHRYARLEYYFSRFVKELSNADFVFVTPVFAAWNSTGKVSSVDLATQVHGIALSGSWNEMGNQIASFAKAGDVIAILGAGDLPQILPSLLLSLSEK